MNLRSFITLGLLFFVIILNSACSVNRATSTIDPSTDLSSIKSVYVTKIEADKRGIDILVANKFKEMGFLVSAGVDRATEVDAVVTYEDKWMWDITMYMLELTITLNDPKSDFPLASGNSYHTSLTRKSPEEMVEEVVNNIFNRNEINE